MLHRLAFRSAFLVTTLSLSVACGSADAPPAAEQADLYLLADNTSLTSSVVAGSNRGDTPECEPVRIGSCVFARASSCGSSDPAKAGRVEWTGSYDASTGTTSSFSVSTNVVEGVSASESKPGFVGGEAVHLHVEGGDLLTFDEDHTVPLALLVSSPPAAQRGANTWRITASRDQDLVLDWSRGVSGIGLYLRSDRVSCLFPSEDGVGVVPKEVLERAAPVELQPYTLEEKASVRGGAQTHTGIAYMVATPDKQPIVSIDVL